MKTSCGKFLNLAHYFPYDVKLRLLAHSRSFLANQKARNAIVGAENLLSYNSAARRLLYAEKFSIDLLFENSKHAQGSTHTSFKLSRIKRLSFSPGKITVR